MSDFRITPPSRALGLVRVEDAVTVSFHLILELVTIGGVPSAAD